MPSGGRARPPGVTASFTDRSVGMPPLGLDLVPVLPTLESGLGWALRQGTTTRIWFWFRKSVSRANSLGLAWQYILPGYTPKPKRIPIRQPEQCSSQCV